MKELEVVARILVCGEEILCMQRNKANYYYISYKLEFPGGKLEQWKLPNEAIRRKLLEELDINLNIGEKDYFIVVHHAYPDFNIKLHSYLCRVNGKEIRPKEHKTFQLLKVSAIGEHDWLDIDRPIVENCNIYKQEECKMSRSGLK